MPDLFVYGTLREPVTRSRVLGYMAPRRVVPATAHGWMPARLPGARYPILVKAAGRIALGAILPDLGSKALAFLTSYEGPGYWMSDLMIETAGGTRRAHVFLPTEPILKRAGPPFVRWDYETWARKQRGGARL